ncbi:MAG: S-adenosylmethionine:tRNA ribosyltransferase-isomerase [Tannerella sp.]|jgi:S-adenosylmethionine:tRNA ribosyltransferase-isomerase|nr:S-adenosylmethionine:tRNA ribosyltransferase-isomerase [Tannerella sp.]
MNEKSTSVGQIRIDGYDYPLPDHRIAKFPLDRRDTSKLLVYRDREIGETAFDRLPDCLPDGALIVFNNTRVIRARIMFRKETGAAIEIFCLEPEYPADYAQNFQSRGRCRWQCLVGNLKRWKDGRLRRSFPIGGDVVTLEAERIRTCGQAHGISFEWDNPSYTFADILDAAGVLPIPPYLHRETVKSDLETYQTVYSKIKGSVAAPTAGLHFTPAVMDALLAKGCKMEELTLHIGAGTFKPVQTATIGEHEMHTEHLAVGRSTIASLLEYAGRTTAVGTTSVRTLESLYHIGAILAVDPDADPSRLEVKQWTPYEGILPDIPTATALANILKYLDRNGLEKIVASTKIIIAPGYRFRIVNSMITNFHQPRSTLLLLVSAFVGGDWRRIYDYALSRDFRFLSYGDASLLTGVNSSPSEKNEIRFDG